MPKLSEIEVFLDSSYPKEEGRSFIFKSRCQCNYLERKLAREAFVTDYSRINIFCSRRDGFEEYTDLSKAAPYLEVFVKYNLPELKTLSLDDLQKHYSNIITQGLRVAQTCMPVPYERCLEILREFEQNGYKNAWVHSDKFWKKNSCRSLIEAELTIERFVLYHSMFLSGELVGKRKVAEAKPREALFIFYFGQSKIIDGKYIVYETRKRVISVFDLEEKQFVGKDVILERGHLKSRKGFVLDF